MALETWSRYDSLFDETSDLGICFLHAREAAWRTGVDFVTSLDLLAGIVFTPTARAAFFLMRFDLDEPRLRRALQSFARLDRQRALLPPDRGLLGTLASRFHNSHSPDAWDAMFPGDPLPGTAYPGLPLPPREAFVITPKLKRVIDAADAASASAGRENPDSMDLLLALAREESVAQSILFSYGVDPISIRVAAVPA